MADQGTILCHGGDKSKTACRAYCSESGAAEVGGSGGSCPRKVLARGACGWWGAYGWLVKGVLHLGRIWLAGVFVWGASGWLVRGILRLGRVWMASEGRLTSGAHLVGW